VSGKCDAKNSEIINNESVRIKEEPGFFKGQRSENTDFLSFLQTPSIVNFCLMETTEIHLRLNL